ncbi:MAG: fimbrillin family protein [Bacteroidales bacterium]|nr:fimbrillin family protein [Bacteroidales bacterium]
MKRNIFLAILLTAAVSFSCTSVEEPMQVERAREGSTVFNPVAVITPFVLDGPETKTALTIDETTGAKFTFVETDVLGVYPTFPEAGTQVAFEVKSISTDGVVFNGGGFGLKEGNEYSVYYPFTPDGCETISQAEAYMQEFPVDYSGQRQAKVDGTFDISKKDYLVAVGVEPADGVCTMNMSHVGALVVMDVTLTGSAKATYESLTLASDSGLFTVDGAIDLTNGIDIDPDATSDVITLALGTETSGLKLKAGNYRFCMMVAPVDMSDATLTLSLVDDEENVYSTTVAGRNFKAGKAYKLAATIAGPNLTTPTNLSENGTANTYIVDTDAVNPLGYYFNATVAGNGENNTITYLATLGVQDEYRYPVSSSAISGAGVKAIWIENECISDLAYDATNNTITFKASGAKGNAKVTLTKGADGTGDGVWTWLIWCTDEPKTVAYHSPGSGFDFTVLDRNIGAITGGPSTDIHAQVGMFYEFGRPTPFLKSETYVNSNASSMENALALHPETWFANGDLSWAFNVWLLSTANGNYQKQVYGLLWGGWSLGLVTTWGNYAQKPINQIPKTIYDPCPAGYQVAPYSFFNGMSLAGCPDDLGRYVAGTNDKLYLPCNGILYNGDYIWSSGEPNYYISLWTLQHNNSLMAIAWLGGSGGSPSFNDLHVGRGCSVRCVAEN